MPRREPARRARMRRIAAPLAAALLAASPALAQTGGQTGGQAGAQPGVQAGGQPPWAAAPPWAPVAQPDGDSTVVSELDVQKRLPGPALWRVSRGASQVVILGALVPLPHLLQWDTGPIQHALQGADALLLPPRPRFGVFDAIRLMFDKGGLQLPRGRTLEQVLPPAERERFLRLTRTIHTSPKTYDRWKPAVAGFLLIADFRRAAGLSEGKPATTVEKLAKADHVPVRYVGDFRAEPYVQAVAKLSDAANLACFDAALDDIDRESAHARPAAKAWAEADLKTVRQAYAMSVFDRCLLQVPSVQALVERGDADGVQEIEQALARPGKSVAVIDLNFLLHANGVLDRLKARGDEISIPQG